MYRGRIERVVAVANTQKSCGLLERLGPDARNLQHLGTRAEAAFLVAPSDEVQCGALADAGDVTQQRPR